MATTPSPATDRPRDVRGTDSGHFGAAPMTTATAIASAAELRHHELGD
ncbi:hypothetical protein [Actinokineospora sp. NBRC 105648]|nr:hypothetical protein [Actinokineospora sp. NBRC 105648]